MSVITTYLNDNTQTPVDRFVVYTELFARWVNSIRPIPSPFT